MRWAAVLALLLLTGCGGGEPAPDAAPTLDAGPRLDAGPDCLARGEFCTRADQCCSGKCSGATFSCH